MESDIRNVLEDAAWFLYGRTFTEVCELRDSFAIKEVIKEYNKRLLAYLSVKVSNLDFTSLEGPEIKEAGMKDANLVAKCGYLKGHTEALVKVKNILK